MGYQILLKCFKENGDNFLLELTRFIRDECDLPCDGFCSSNCYSGMDCELAFSHALWEKFRGFELAEEVKEDNND